MKSEISYTKIFNRIKKYKDEYNKDKPLRDQIRAPHTNLMIQLIRIYAGFLRKQRALGIESEHEHPPIFVNNVQLAKRCDYSSRAIQNHINRLIEAGLIKEKIWHGSNSSYELFLETKIIAEPCRREKSPMQDMCNEVLRKIHSRSEKQGNTNIRNTEAPALPSERTNERTNERQSEQNPEQSERTSERANGKANERTVNNSLKTPQFKENHLKKSMLKSQSFPHTDTFYSKKFINNNNNKVENFQSKTLNDNTTHHQSKGIRYAHNNPFDEKNNKEVKNCAPNTDLKKVRLLAKLFWLTTVQTLYRDWTFTDKSIQEATQLIIQNFYLGVPADKLDKVHGIYITMLLMAGKWKKKNDWYNIARPSIYFDLQRGDFIKTKAWYEQHVINQKKTKLEKILRGQLRKFYNNRSGKTKIPQSELKTFMQCEQRLGKLHNQILIDKFHIIIGNHYMIEDVNSMTIAQMINV